MGEEHPEPQSAENLLAISEDDPELERDLRVLAQWLFDVYLWRLEEERKSSTQPPIDKPPSPPTI